MAHSYHEIAFTPTILKMQVEAGSRDGYAAMGGELRYANVLTAREVEFIARRDSFYMASVSETGWPYVQHRGGPVGFMKVLDGRTIGFADYSGNRQYLSTGNFRHDDRVSLFFMDYPNRRRLKMFGRVRVVDIDQADILARLEDPDYPVSIERAVLITVEGFDWNCPAHITPRYTEAQIDSALLALRDENRRLQAMLEAGPGAQDAATDMPAVLGAGVLELVISGVRQLTGRVRAYELRDPGGEPLPAVEPGSHLRVPIRLPDGAHTERYYSIASNPSRRDLYEIAVLRENAGAGGSKAIHASFEPGMRLRMDLPANHFKLHSGSRPAVLIAGGIGITAIKPMAQALEDRGTDFHLHYAGRSRPEMAFRDRLERQLGDRISVYSAQDGERMDLGRVLARAPSDALVYVCGPERMIADVFKAAAAVGVSRERIRTERYA